MQPTDRYSVPRHLEALVWRQNILLKALALSLVAGAGALACSDESGDVDGRLFVAPLTASDGTAVGLAVDFIPTSGDPSRIDQIELEVVSSGAEFLDAGDRVCMRFARTGRLSLLAASGQLEPTARVILRARHPSLTNGVDGGAGAGGTAGNENPTCTGALIDDAAWPTRGAQVVVLPGTGGAQASGGSSTGGGAGHEAGGSPGSAGEGGSDGGAAGGQP